jgi:thiamine-monophosphate kinase
LGIEDYFDWGWLLAAINLSDLAAAGATPVGLVTSLTLPASMRVSEFQRLLDGIDACCTLVKTKVIGGNLKEATDGTIRCEATAFGLVPSHQAFSRRGSAVNDSIVAFGPTGAFWAAVLQHKSGVPVEAKDVAFLRAALVKPLPQLAVASALREVTIVHSCTDASDGLYAAMVSLTTEQGLGALLEPRSWRYPAAVRAVANALAVDPVRLALGFGDLQIVCTLPQSDVPKARGVARDLGVHMVELGRVTDSGEVLVELGGGFGVLNNFDNERFSSNSEFTVGLDAYQERLLDLPIVRA